jgi:hypothetical protein
MHQPARKDWYSPKTTKGATLDINHITEYGEAVSLLAQANNSTQKF